MRFCIGFFQRIVLILFCLLLLQSLPLINNTTNFYYSFLSRLLTINPVNADNITDSIVLVDGRLRYDRRAKTSYVGISLQNTSSDTILSPVRVIIGSITDPNVDVANEDGTTVTGKPYFEYVFDGVLAPGETTDAKTWVFNNPLRKRFSFTLESIEGEIEAPQDDDTDGDGTPDDEDGCPLDPEKIDPGICGCGVADTDTDNDGTPDCNDQCPDDPGKTAPGTCGCGFADTDTDGDGEADCLDGCPEDPLKTGPGICGCGVADTDTDNDGAPDCNDQCPDDPGKTAPGNCGFGVADTDTDGDSTADCLDGCPEDPLKTEPGICGCGVPDTDSDGDGIPDCQEGPTAGNPPQVNVSPLAYSIPEGETLTITVSASDPDGEPVTLSGFPHINNAQFSATPGITATGVFTFTPGYNQQGGYTVGFRAVDILGNTDTAQVRITVENVNRSPVMETIENVNVDEGKLLTIPVTATDPDGDLLTLTADPVPANAIFISSTGTLTFAPDYDQSGIYDIYIEADDGDMSTEQMFQITVNDVSDPSGGPGELVLNVDPVESPSLLTTARITGNVNASGTAQPERLSSALISGISPATVRQGQTLDILLTGDTGDTFATNFSQDISSPEFGDDITVNAVTVENPAQMTVNITVSANAEIGPRSVSVVTGTETAFSVVALNVSTGVSGISGKLIDPETGAPLANAFITLQGTNFSTTTDANGDFVLYDVPTGEWNLVFNAADHELIILPVKVVSGSVLELDAVETESVVFNPSAPPSASIHSLLARYAVQSRLTLEQAKILVLDTILCTGGDEIGALDEYGNQLNPKVNGNGLISLTNEAVEAYAERLVIGKTVRLMDLLLGISLGFEWKGGEPPTLDEWIQSLQEVVNLAWQYPGDPDARLPILLFNSGNTLTPTPPVITAVMHLDDLKAFMLFSAFLTGYDMFTVEGVGAPFGIGNNPITGGVTKKTSVLLAMADEPRVFRSPAAHDSPGDPSNLSYYLTDEFRHGMDAVASAGIAGAFVAPLVPLEMGLFDRIFQGDFTEAFGHVIGEHYMNSICAPPRLIDATVFDQDTQHQATGVRFYRSQTDPGARFNGYSGSGMVGNRRYAYHLYREEYKKGGVTLVPVSYEPWETDDPEVLILVDSDPQIGMNSYRVVFLHGEISIPLEAMFEQKDLNKARLARWAGHVVELGTEVDNVPLGPFHSMLHKPSSYLSRLSETSVSISMPDPIVSAQNPVKDLVVNKNTGRIYLGDREFDEIVEIDPLHGVDRTLVARTGFAQPGQVGLAVDPNGDLITENAASDSRFGGRLFRFTSTGSKRYAGQVNYYSELLGQANPVSVACLASDFLGNIYVADNYDKQIKKLSMAQALAEGWPTNRIVGKGINAGLSSGFSSFTDIQFIGDTFYVTAFDKMYRWQSSAQGLISFADIPDAIFSGMAADDRGQLYVACQGISTPGEKTGFVLVLPSGSTFHNADDAKPFIFFDDLTYPGDIEVSADGKALIYTEGGRPKAKYFGISGYLTDQYGQPISATGNNTFVKVYSDLGESQWVRVDEDGMFSIMGLLAPGQDFKGADAKLITLVIRNNGYTTERQVRLNSKGQTILSVTHNPYEIIFDPPDVEAGPDGVYTVHYTVIERGTNQDVTDDVFNLNMIEQSIGSQGLIQIISQDVGQFTFSVSAEPDDAGTYTAITLRDPDSGTVLATKALSVFGRQFDIALKTAPCEEVTSPSGTPYTECYGTEGEFTLARGRIIPITAEVSDGSGTRITELADLISSGLTLEMVQEKGAEGFEDLIFNEINPGEVEIEIPADSDEGSYYYVHWELRETSDDQILAQSDTVTIRVRDFSISKELVLENDPPGLNEDVDYIIKITNYSDAPISGEFSDIVPDVLDILATTPNVTASGNSIENTIEIGADREEVISIGCRVNDTNFNTVINTASFTYNGTTKTDSALFGAQIKLFRAGPATMSVRGVDRGWKQKFVERHGGAVPTKFCPPLQECTLEECSRDGIKQVELDQSLVTLYGTTEIIIEVEITGGENEDTVTFTQDIDSDHISFSSNVAHIVKEGAVGIAQTTLTVSDLWNDPDILAAWSKPNKLTVTASSETHGEVSFDIEIFDNMQYLIYDVYMKHPAPYSITGIKWPWLLEQLGDAGKPLITLGWVGINLANQNNSVCNVYRDEALAIFNDLRERPDKIWYFNGIDYGPIQNYSGFKTTNPCEQNDPGDWSHYAVALYPTGFFKTAHCWVVDGWFTQNPMVWEYDDWFYQNSRWFDSLLDWMGYPEPDTATPGQTEMELNYPNSNWFDPEIGYPAWDEGGDFSSTAANKKLFGIWLRDLNFSPDQTTSMILRCPVSFVITDEDGRRSGKDDQGNKYDEIPGMGKRVMTFPEGDEDNGYILNGINKNIRVDLYPQENGTASFSALRHLPDGSARMDIYESFPVSLGNSWSYEPDPESMETPVLEMTDGTLKPPDLSAEVLVVSTHEPLPYTTVSHPYPLITVKLSRAVDPEKIDAGSFTLKNYESGEIVPCDIDYDSETRTMTISPMAPLRPNMQYVALVKILQVPVVDQQVEDFEYAWPFITDDMVSQ